MSRTTVPTGDDSGDSYGYSRAVRVGDLVFVSGTTPARDQLARGTYEQAVSALSVIASALVTSSVSP